MENMINWDRIWLIQEIGKLYYQQGQLEQFLQNENLGKIEKAITELELKHCSEKIELLQKLLDEINEEQN